MRIVIAGLDSIFVNRPDAYEPIIYDQNCCDGQPSVYYIQLTKQAHYWINHIDKTDTVQNWMDEREYVWHNMSEQEEWELEMFMRSL